MDNLGAEFPCCCLEVAGAAAAAFPTPAFPFTSTSQFPQHGTSLYPNNKEIPQNLPGI